MTAYSAQMGVGIPLRARHAVTTRSKHKEDAATTTLLSVMTL